MPESAIWIIECDDDSGRHIVATWDGPWGYGAVDLVEAVRRFEEWCHAPYEQVVLRREGKFMQGWRPGTQTYSQSVGKMVEEIK